MSILSLYHSILIPILSEWINDRNLCSVDTSVCSKNLRPVFLNTLRRCSIIHSAFTEKHYEERLEWIQMRDMKLLTYKLGNRNTMMMSEKLSVILSTSKRVSHITVAGCIAFSDLITRDELKVDSLKLQSISSDDVLEAILTALGGVFTIDASDLIVMPRLVCSIIAATCPHLSNLIVPSRAEIQPILENCDVECVKYVDSRIVFNLTGSQLRFSCELVKSSIESDFAITLCNKFYLIKGLVIMKQLTQEEVQVLAPHIDALESIQFSNTSEQYDQDLILSLIAAKCTRLTEIVVKGIRINESNWDAALWHNKHIKRISLIRCDIDTNASLSAVTRNCPKLEYLNFETADTLGCSDADETLIELIEKCKFLNELKMDSVTLSAKVLCESSWSIDSLIHVDVNERCPILWKQYGGMNLLYLTNKTEPTLKEFLLILENNPRLRKLFIPSNYTLNRESLQSIVKCCPLLAHFSCTHQTVDCDEALLPLAECKHLVTLRFHDNSIVTDFVLTEILKEKTGFLSVSLNYCSRLTGAVLLSIAQYCPNIKHVSINGCSAVTDKDVITFLNHCTHIDCLSLYGCRSVTAAILPYIKRNRMRFLSLKNTSITHSDVEDFVAATGFSCTIQFEF